MKNDISPNKDDTVFIKGLRHQFSVCLDNGKKIELSVSVPPTWLYLENEPKIPEITSSVFQSKDEKARVSFQFYTADLAKKKSQEKNLHKERLIMMLELMLETQDDDLEQNIEVKSYPMKHPEGKDYLVYLSTVFLKEGDGDKFSMFSIFPRIGTLELAITGTAFYPENKETEALMVVSSMRLRSEKN